VTIGTEWQLHVDYKRYGAEIRIGTAEIQHTNFQNEKVIKGHKIADEDSNHRKRTLIADSTRLNSTNIRTASSSSTLSLQR